MKITEKQLRNIIKEAINELDWKTYANAAWKEDMINNDNLKGDNSRAQRFRQAAIDAFNKEHGYKNGEEEYSMLYDRDEAFDGITPAVYDTKYGEPDEYDTTKQTPSWEQNPERYTRGHMFDVYSTNGSESANHLKHKYYGNKKKSASNPKDSIPKNYSANLKQAIINGNKEISRYVNGDYDYTPEKGWHLNENQLRSIIRETIEEILAHDTVTSAYDKMRRYGSHSRANNFAKNYSEILNREYPIVNDSGHEARFLADSNELYLMDDTNNYFHYNVKDDDWYVSKDGRMVPVEREPNGFPKFNNRQTVINLCKFMKQLKPDTGLANKQYYIH